jgi:hypothetical protein
MRYNITKTLTMYFSRYSINKKGPGYTSINDKSNIQFLKEQNSKPGTVGKDEKYP